MTDTMVLIHGNFPTRRTWEPWVARYSARGYKVVSIAYPGPGHQRRQAVSRAVG